MEHYSGDTSAVSTNINKLSRFYPLQEHPIHLYWCTNILDILESKPHLSFHLLLCTRHSVNDTNPGHSAAPLTISIHTRTPPCHLTGIPLGCHGVPMATLYLHHLSVEESRTQFSSSCGFWMSAHKGRVTRKNKNGKEKNRRVWKIFCFGSKHMETHDPSKAFVCCC